MWVVPSVHHPLFVLTHQCGEGVLNPLSGDASACPRPGPPGLRSVPQQPGGAAHREAGVRDGRGLVRESAGHPQEGPVPGPPVAGVHTQTPGHALQTQGGPSSVLNAVR